MQNGFPYIRTQGREFLLNGKRLVLNGVCRHDLWLEEGFTLSRRQQEQDMRMIKSIGCNFIRLVHYPHDRHIVELADEIGLMVSEEPGFWQVDFRTLPRGQTELGYEILGRTIRRDWNSPSVVAWLLANECTLTTEFLKEGKRRCNAIDPLRRLVSAANDRSADITRPMYEEAGMDFFDRHLYTFQMEDFEKEADFYGPGKPLTFTEWGGKAIGQGLPEMQDTVNMILKLEQEGKISGTSFWSWQDLRQYTRVDPEMHDGVLESGVVTESREPRDLVVRELNRLFELRRHVDQQPDSKPEEIPLKKPTWSKKKEFEPLDLQPLAETADADRAWSSFKERMAKMLPFWKAGQDFLLWQATDIKVSGVKFNIPVVNGRARPLILTPEVSQIAIPLSGKAEWLQIQAR